MILQEIEDDLPGCVRRRSECDPVPPTDEPPRLQGEPLTTKQDGDGGDYPNDIEAEGTWKSDSRWNSSSALAAQSGHDDISKASGNPLGISLSAVSAGAGSLADHRVTLPVDIFRKEHGHGHTHHRNSAPAPLDLEGSAETDCDRHDKADDSNALSASLDSSRDRSLRRCVWMKRDDVRDELQTVKDTIELEFEQLRHFIKTDLQEVLEKQRWSSSPPASPYQSTIDTVKKRHRLTRAKTCADALPANSAEELDLKDDSPKSVTSPSVFRKTSCSSTSSSKVTIANRPSIKSHESEDGQSEAPNRDHKRQHPRRSEKPHMMAEAKLNKQFSMGKHVGVVQMRRLLPEEDEYVLPSKELEQGNWWTNGKPGLTHAATLNDIDKVAKTPAKCGEQAAQRKSLARSFSFAGKAKTMPLNDEYPASGAGAVNGFEDITASDLAVIPSAPDGKNNGQVLRKSKESAINLEETERANVSRSRRMRQIVLIVIEDSIFDYVISGCIMFNAVFIGAQSDFQIKHLESDTPAFYDAVERFFFIVFTCELVLRLYGYRLHFFVNSEWKWNWFDFFIVTLQISEEFMTFFEADTGAKVDEVSDNVNFIRVLRILRLVRVLRLVRLLRFVAELRAMVCSILGSFKSLCWTIVLLMLMIYVASVYLIQLIVDLGQTSPEAYREEKVFEEFYGSIPRAVLTLFQAMTGGVDWNDLVVPLMEHISPFMAIVFSLYIAFAVLAMMNVITGVFVESALMTAKEDKEKDMIIRVRRLFTKTDEDNSGTISWQEFMARCSDPEMVKYFKALEIDLSEARGLFQLLDTDGSGEVSAEEFIMGCVRLRGPAKAIDLATMMYFNKRISIRWRAHMEWIEDELEEIYELLEAVSSWTCLLVPQVTLDMEGEALSNTESGDTASRGQASSITEATKGSILVQDDAVRLRMSLAEARRQAAAARHSEPKQSQRPRDQDDECYATWADLKAQGRRKASIDMHGSEEVIQSGLDETEADGIGARGSLRSSNSRARGSLRSKASLRSNTGLQKEISWFGSFSPTGVMGGFSSLVSKSSTRTNT